MSRTDRPLRPVELSAMDLDMPRISLKPVTTLLGIGVELLAARTIAAAYPWATGLVARGTLAPGHLRGPKLRYAACPHCLEEQRLERGVSWLRRAWVLAPRTVCSVHRIPLIAAQPGGTTHPVWSDFRHRHRQAGLEAPAITPPSQLLSDSGPAAVLHREMAMVQDAILAAASRGQQRAGSSGEGRAVTANDLAWAFTQADRHHPDLLAYKAFASDRLDNLWHAAQRRRPGPVDFVARSLEERHQLLATAMVPTRPPSLRRTFYPPPGT